MYKKKKLITIIVGIALGGSVLSGLMPAKAEAAVPIFETNATIIAAAIATAGATTSHLTQNLFEWAQSFVISTLKKRLLDLMVDQIISYIQGGGKPQFVTDWKGFLADAGQAAAGDFAQEVGLGFLCSPFNLQVQLYLLPVKKFSQQATCTLNQIVGNIQAFYKDFRSGGWLAYGEGWQPQNNFFGALLMATQESEFRKSRAVSANYNDAIAGGGYTSARDKNGNIITPGSTLGSLTSKAAGSDIDYILSADQLADYASAIANALFNRILKEGVAQVKVAISGSNAQTDASSLIASNFQFQKDTVLDGIDQTLTPRQDAKTILNSSLAVLTDYQTKLNKLSADFSATGKTVCQSNNFQVASVSVAVVKQQIMDELAAASTTLAQIKSDLASNQVIVDSLLAAETKIQALSNDTAGYIRLNEINGQIASQLNSAEAVSFKAAAEEQNTAINSNISQKLATFNQQLTVCLQNP